MRSGCDILTGILVADRRCCLFTLKTSSPSNFNSDLAAYGAADTCKISLFHILASSLILGFVDLDRDGLQVRFLSDLLLSAG